MEKVLRSKSLYINFIIANINIPVLVWGILMPTVLLLKHDPRLLIMLSVLLICCAFFIMLIILKPAKINSTLLLQLAAFISFFSSSLLLISSSYLDCLIFGAVTVSISAIVVPFYLNQILPNNISNKIVLIFPIFILIGILLGFFINLLNIDRLFIVLFFIVITGFYFFVSFKLPVSPWWLIAKRRENKAIDELIKLRGDNYHVELAEIKSEIAKIQKDDNKCLMPVNKNIIIAIIINIIIICFIYTLFSFFKGI